MTHLNLQPSLGPRQVRVAVTRAISVIGWDLWRKRIAQLEQEVSAEPFWKAYLVERHGYELALGGICKYRRLTGRLPWPPHDFEYRTYSFLAMFSQIYDQLSSSGRKRLVGSVRGALQKDSGLGPIAYEMRIAAHLSHRGFLVEAHDLESQGGYDFLAVSGSTEIEVECKHISGDIGRKIPHAQLYRVGRILAGDIALAAESSASGRILKVEIADRFPTKDDEQRALVSCVRQAITSRVLTQSDRQYRLSESSFEIENTPFRSPSPQPEEISTYIEGPLGVRNKNVLVSWRPSRGAIIVIFESAREDTVLESIYNNLKDDAARQFSKSRPTILFVNLASIRHESLRAVAMEDKTGKPAGITRMVDRLFNKRPHLHFVSVTTPGELQVADIGPLRATTSEIGLSYTYRNPACLNTTDPVIETAFS